MLDPDDTLHGELLLRGRCRPRAAPRDEIVATNRILVLRGHRRPGKPTCSPCTCGPDRLRDLDEHPTLPRPRPRRRSSSTEVVRRAGAAFRREDPSRLRGRPLLHELSPAREAAAVARRADRPVPLPQARGRELATLGEPWRIPAGTPTCSSGYLDALPGRPRSEASRVPEWLQNFILLRQGCWYFEVEERPHQASSAPKADTAERMHRLMARRVRMLDPKNVVEASGPRLPADLAPDPAARVLTGAAGTPEYAVVDRHDTAQGLVRVGYRCRGRPPEPGVLRRRARRTPRLTSKIRSRRIYFERTMLAERIVWLPYGADPRQARRRRVRCSPHRTRAPEVRPGGGGANRDNPSPSRWSSRAVPHRQDGQGLRGSDAAPARRAAPPARKRPSARPGSWMDRVAQRRRQRRAPLPLPARATAARSTPGS